MKKLLYKGTEFYSGGFFYNPATKSVMLHKRDAGAPVNPSKWAFFGGTSEPGETPLQTFLREIEEELCLRLTPEEVQPLCDYLNTDRNIHRYVFIVEKAVEKSQCTLTEGEDFGWIPLSDVFKYDITDKTEDDLKYFIRQLAASSKT